MKTSAVLRKRFGVRAAALMRAKEISRGELVTQTALSAGRLHLILEGRLVRITLRDMSIIAGALGAPLADFLTPGEPMVPVKSLEEVEEGGTGDA